MRDYQPKKNSYYMDKTVYKRALAVARDYERMRRDYNDLLYGTSRSDGQPRGGVPSDPTALKAIRMEALRRDMWAIEDAIQTVPPEYRKAVMCKTIHDVWPPGTPTGKNLPTYWKQRFLHKLAENLNLI